MENYTLINATKDDIHPLTHSLAISGNGEYDDIDTKKVRIMKKSEFRSIISHDADTLYMLTKDEPIRVINNEMMIPHTMVPFETRWTGAVNLADGTPVQLNKDLILIFAEIHPYGQSPYRIYDRRTGFWITGISHDMVTTQSGIPPNTGPINISSSYSPSAIINCGDDIVAMIYDGRVNVIKFPPNLAAINKIGNFVGEVLPSSYSFPLDGYKNSPYIFGRDDATGALYGLFKYMSASDTTYSLYRITLGDIDTEPTYLEMYSGTLPDGYHWSYYCSVAVSVDATNIKLVWTNTGEEIFSVSHNKNNGEFTSIITMQNPELPATEYDNIESRCRYDDVRVVGDLVILTSNNNNGLNPQCASGYISDSHIPLIYYKTSTGQVSTTLINYDNNTEHRGLGLVMCDDGVIYKFGNHYMTGPHPWVMRYDYVPIEDRAWSTPNVVDMFKDMDMGDVRTNNYNIIMMGCDPGTYDDLYLIPYGDASTGDVNCPLKLKVNINTITSDNAGDFIRLPDSFLAEHYLPTTVPPFIMKASFMVNDIYGTDATSMHQSICTTTRNYDDGGVYYNSLGLDFTDGSGFVKASEKSSRVVPYRHMYAPPMAFTSAGTPDNYFGTMPFSYSGKYHGIYRHFRNMPMCVNSSGTYDVITSPVGITKNGHIIVQRILLADNPALPGRKGIAKTSLYTMDTLNTGTPQLKLLVEEVAIPDWVDDSYNSILPHDLFNMTCSPLHRKTNGSVVIPIEQYATKTYMCMDHKYIVRMPGSFFEPNSFNNSYHDKIFSTSDIPRSFDVSECAMHTMCAYNIEENRWIKLQEPNFTGALLRAPICVQSGENEFKFLFGGNRKGNDRYQKYTTCTYDLSKDINIINDRTMT